MERKITIVGAGVSGCALAVFAADNGAEVFVTDRGADLSDDKKKLFREHSIEWEAGGHTERCTQCTQMVVSSGVSPASEAVRMAYQKEIPVLGELDFLAPYLKGKIIAVTGTNGKTTCTSLIGHILKHAGLNAAAAGNIGEPLAAQAGKPHDALVLELSSFQLSWNNLLKPDVSVLTNLAPDHINWHGSYENYIAAKCRIFIPKAGECFAVTHQCDAFRVPAGRTVCVLGSGACSVSLDGSDVILNRNGRRKVLFHKSSLSLIGAHNLENAAMSAAAAVLAFPDIDPDSNLAEFRALPHRCEKVAEKNGVLYVDDSKGTNVAAVITALRSIAGPKVIILGGQGKGENYDSLAEAVKEQTTAAVVIGSEADRIIDALQRNGYRNWHRAADMAEAVEKCSKLARSGDTVLLSPACTSWDMYHNFEERGDHFAALVRQLR
ncbi:MAG: UDP-N-acetylmuramoyl-L-alanine--D-glutamate ligase [Pyramidobacter sp.]|jgi:UDP-N-acetylmuramoylalanine--D-glutamate ligase